MSFDGNVAGIIGASPLRRGAKPAPKRAKEPPILNPLGSWIAYQEVGLRIKMLPATVRLFDMVDKSLQQQSAKTSGTFNPL
jgi:hypothetical protein